MRAEDDASRSRESGAYVARDEVMVESFEGPTPDRREDPGAEEQPNPSVEEQPEVAAMDQPKMEETVVVTTEE